MPTGKWSRPSGRIGGSPGDGDSWNHGCASAVRSGGRILEVGAGTGANLDTLRAFGRVTALEPDAFACDYISRHFDVDTVRAALPKGAAGLEGFDLIVALDVLEHIDD